MTPTEVARQLRDYLTRTGRFGTAATPDNAVEIAQRALGVTADGIVGAGTRAAARKLGVTLPLRKAVAK
jgi:lysozyme family protein